MDEATKKRVRNYIPHAVCSRCGSKQNYRNPIDRCEECKKKYCFDHIWGGLYSPTRMKKTDALRSICDEDKIRYGYK